MFPYVNRASINRIMYLSTFIGSDGYLIDDDGMKINKLYAKELAKLSPYRMALLMSDTGPNGYLEEDRDGNLKFGDCIAFKQPPDWLKCGDTEDWFGGVTRLYTDVTRSMYVAGVTGRIKSVMSNVYLELPYLHTEFNIACYNPLEKDPSKIRPLSLDGFAEVMGCERYGVAGIAKNLEKFIFEIDGRTEKVFAFAPRPDLGINKMCAHVNPHIVYAGHKENAAKALAVFQ